MAAPRIPREVARHLGYYVYLYIDPRTRKPFYVGKGKGTRLLAHTFDRNESRKTQVLGALRRAGRSAKIEVLTHQLPNEEAAYRIEAAVIDLLRLDSLTNQVSGWKSVQLGRKTIADLVGYYAARPAQIRHPALLIRINRLYRHGMTARELYEATRGVWKLGPRRTQAKFAMAVFEGVVREVYAIDRWYPAGSQPSRTAVHTNPRVAGRWEFAGRVAGSGIRHRYIDHSVTRYFPAGAQNPVAYVKCR